MTALWSSAEMERIGRMSRRVYHAGGRSPMGDSPGVPHDLMSQGVMQKRPAIRISGLRDGLDLGCMALGRGVEGLDGIVDVLKRVADEVVDQAVVFPEDDGVFEVVGGFDIEPA